MNKMVSKKEIERALEKTVHPEINNSLVELGMIKDIKIKDSEILITLLLPFLEVPIKEDLINIIKEQVEKLDKDVNIKINVAEMNSEEKGNFMKMANEGWVF